MFRKLFKKRPQIMGYEDNGLRFQCPECRSSGISIRPPSIFCGNCKYKFMELTKKEILEIIAEIFENTPDFSVNQMEELRKTTYGMLYREEKKEGKTL